MSQSALPNEPAEGLADLRRRVEDLLDSDQLLPADGHALLAMLERAQEQVAAGEIAEAGGLLLGLETLLQALHDTGVLDPEASGLCIVAARAAAASLSEMPT